MVNENATLQKNAAAIWEILQGLRLLDPDSAPAHSPGTIFWNAAALGPEIHMEPDGVTMSVGMESYELVYNDTGVQIDDGDPVYRSGVDATNFVSEISLARADDPIKALSFMGEYYRHTPDEAETLLRGNWRPPEWYHEGR